MSKKESLGSFSIPFLPVSGFSSSKVILSSPGFSEFMGKMRGLSALAAKVSVTPDFQLSGSKSSLVPLSLMCG